MSTNPVTPNPTTTPTPAPAPSNDLAQLREAAMAASAPASPPSSPPPDSPPPPPAAAVPPAAPEPYQLTETPEGVEIKLETGAVYKGKTWQEAVAQVAKGKVESDKTIRQMRATAQPTVPEPPATAPTATQETPEQIQARAWVMEQFSKSPEGQAILSVIQQTQQSNLAAAFMQRCPDFPNTDEASTKLVELATSLGVPPTVDGLEAAHMLAMRRGMYQGVTPATPASARPTPPPMLTPSSPVPSSGQPTDADLRTMDMKQLRELALKSSGGQ